MAIPFLQAPKLAALGHIKHGFTCRYGGDSSPPWDDFNLGDAVGDAVHRVRMHRQRVAQDILSIAGDDLRWLKQVHGIEIAEPIAASIAAPKAEVPGVGDRGFDGAWSDTKGLGVAIAVADCVPVLLAHKEAPWVAGVHAGWRGLQAGILGEILACAKAQGFAAGDLVAAVGPSLGGCCFWASKHIWQQMIARFGLPLCVQSADLAQSLNLSKDLPQRLGALAGFGPGRLGLGALCRADLIRGGISKDSVDWLSLCTACDPRFFSYRRDGWITGRQCAAIALSIEG